MRPIIAALVGVLLLTMSACSDSAEPEPAPTITVRETVEVEPEPAPTVTVTPLAKTEVPQVCLDALGAAERLTEDMDFIMVLLGEKLNDERILDTIPQFKRDSFKEYERLLRWGTVACQEEAK